MEGGSIGPKPGFGIVSAGFYEVTETDERTKHGKGNKRDILGRGGNRRGGNGRRGLGREGRAFFMGRRKFTPTC